MARIIKLEGPISALRGSISKDSNVTFKTMYGKIYMVRKPHPRSRPYTKEEIARWKLFSDVSKEVAAILNNHWPREVWADRWKQSGYKQVTLRGYIFSQLYKKALQDKQKQN